MPNETIITIYRKFSRPSAKLLKPGIEDRGFAGKIARDFKRFRAFYGRLLDITLKSRPAVYMVWITVSLLTIPMFIMSPKELAPTEDEGVIFGILEASANSTLDQTSRYAVAVNQAYLSVPETRFTFQVTRPTSGFSGMVAKPWEARERTIFQILPEVQQKLWAIPGIRIFPVLPPALPGGGGGPDPRPRERRPLHGHPVPRGPGRRGVRRGPAGPGRPGPLRPDQRRPPARRPARLRDLRRLSPCKHHGREPGQRERTPRDGLAARRRSCPRGTRQPRGGSPQRRPEHRD
mgnify:CR=1 FL=1